VKAQITDSIKCDEYFKDFGNVKSLTLWSRAPILKENNTSVLCELCNTVLTDSCTLFVATLILDTIGSPVCIQINPEITNDSIKDEVTKLLYQLKFKPALGNKNPVMSYYPIVINRIKCEMYKNMSKQKKKEK